MTFTSLCVSSHRGDVSFLCFFSSVCLFRARISIRIVIFPCVHMKMELFVSPKSKHPAIIIEKCEHESEYEKKKRWRCGTEDKKWRLKKYPLFVLHVFFYSFFTISSSLFHWACFHFFCFLDLKTFFSLEFTFCLFIFRFASFRTEIYRVPWQDQKCIIMIQSKNKFMFFLCSLSFSLLELCVRGHFRNS